MDRNAPEALRDTAQSGYDESKALIAKWHGRGRLLYAITPRFAATQHAGAAGGGGRAVAGIARTAYLQSHVSENRARGRLGEGTVPGAQGLSRRLRPLRPARAARDLRPRHLAHRGRAAALPRDRHRDRALPDVELLPRQRLPRSRARTSRTERPVRVGLAPTSAPARRSRSCGRWARPTRRRSSTGHSLSAGHAFYLATRGAARALYLDDRIGSIAPGMDADLVVLDLRVDAADRATG